MSATQPAYFNAYRSLKLTRDAAGVLVAAFHTRGGPLTFTARITPRSWRLCFENP